MDIADRSEWQGEKFRDIQLANADFFGKTFEDCDFLDCDFIDCNWRNASFINCEFNNCNLSNLTMNNCKLTEVVLNESKLVGLNFAICKNLLFSIRLEKCSALLCNFSNLNLADMSFGSSSFKDCDFYEANLSGADFSKCNLEGSLFENCDLREADFRRAINYAIDPTQNSVKKAKFSMPEVLSFLAPLGLVIE